MNDFKYIFQIIMKYLFLPCFFIGALLSILGLWKLVPFVGFIIASLVKFGASLPLIGFLVGPVLGAIVGAATGILAAFLIAAIVTPMVILFFSGKSICGSIGRCLNKIFCCVRTRPSTFNFSHRPHPAMPCYIKETSPLLTADVQQGDHHDHQTTSKMPSPGRK